MVEAVDYIHLLNIGLSEEKKCIACGTSYDLNTDHYLPKCMIGPRSRRYSLTNHPFWSVVYQPLNEFPFCRKHHNEIDWEKREAFLGGQYDDEFWSVRMLDADRGNPVALIQVLMEKYPMTDNMGYFDLQRKAMMYTNSLFARVAENLNGELPENLKQKYKDAAVVAREYNKKLKSLKPPPLIFAIKSLEAILD